MVCGNFMSGYENKHTNVKITRLQSHTIADEKINHYKMSVTCRFVNNNIANIFQVNPIRKMRRKKINVF